MIEQSAFIDTLMVVALAYIVEHALNQQPNQIHNHQNPNQKPTNHNPEKHPIHFPAVNHHCPEDPAYDSTDHEVHEHQRCRHPRLPLQQLIALLHHREPVHRLQHRHYACEVPQGGDVDMDDDEEQENDHQREEEEQGTLHIDGDDEEHHGGGEHRVVGDHEKANPDEGDEEALENPRNCGHGGGEWDGLGGVKGGHGEDDRGCGEERQGEEEDEVAELESQEKGPLMVGVPWVWGLDLAVERVGEEWMRKNRKGEWKN